VEVNGITYVCACGGGNGAIVCFEESWVGRNRSPIPSLQLTFHFLPHLPPKEEDEAAISFLWEEFVCTTFQPDPLPPSKPLCLPSFRPPSSPQLYPPSSPSPLLPLAHSRRHTFIRVPRVPNNLARLVSRLRRSGGYMYKERRKRGQC
jgi:hypothetical protein